MADIRIYAFTDEAGESTDVQVCAMQRNDLAGAELRNVDGKNIVDLTAAEARELRKKLSDAGKQAWSIGSPIGKIGLEEDFEAHLDRMKNGLEAANILGAGHMRIFSMYVPAGKDPAMYRDAVMECMERFMQTAKGSGVKLCHENEKGIYGDTAERCLELQRAFPDMGCVFDPCNFIQCGVDTLKAWEMLRHFVTYMHIKDGLPDGSVVPAGCGIGNLRAIVPDFVSMGGRDFTIEPHLTSFAGLSDLERESARSRVGHGYVYNDSAEAFDAACGAFRKLIGEAVK